MEQRKRIIVVEDEHHLAVGIKFNLEAEGYEVVTVGDGLAALQYIDEHEAELDLVILDLMLPGMSGYAVCESMRKAGYDVPVLILSARNQSADRTRGFDVGANQYLSKPFDLDELLSRVRNLITHVKRTEKEPKTQSKIQTFSFAGFDLDFEQCTAVREGVRTPLTKREWELLRYFVEREGKLIPRQELLEEVWGLPGHLQTRAPDQFLLRLRKIFEPDPAVPRHFLTMRDLGYQFHSVPKEE